MSSLEQHLQTHARALRALARALVGAQDADDLLQETALQALTAPPRRPGPMGGWLAQVVRHLASKQRRGERRRRRREAALGAAAVRDAATTPPPDEQLATSETFRRLTQAVLALPAPYQDAVLRRYLQAQTPAVIAAQTGVPLATVKSRLQRGLDLLRQRFDGEGGDWRGAFVGTFGLRAAGASLAVGVTTGALVMTGTGVKFALGAAAVALVAAGAFVYFGASASGSPTVGAGESPAALTLAAERAADAGEAAVRADPEARRTIAIPSPAATVDLATLRGRVVDEHGRPCVGVHVALTGRLVHDFDLRRAAAPQPSTKWTDPPAQLTPADGTFAFAFAPREDLVVQGKVGKEMLAMETGWLELVSGSTKDLGDIVLATPGSIRGRVVDAEGRVPAGVEVILENAEPPSRAVTTSQRFLRPPADGNGEFTEPRLSPGSWYVSANGRGGSGRVKIDLAPGATAQVEVVLRLPGEQQTIRGRVVDERGRGLWDVRVRAPAVMGAEANASTERDGTFVLARPEHALVNTSPLQIDGRGFERLLTEPVGWGTKDLEFTLRGGLIVEVTAVAHDGTRIADFMALVARQPEGQFAEHQALDFDLRSDATAPTSVARVGPMLRGRHLVRVLPAGSTFASAAIPLDVRDPGPVRITIRVPQVVESTLRVRDQAREPVADSLVELIDPLGQRVDLDTYALPREKWTPGSGSQRRVDLVQAGRTDAAGELRLRGPARDDLALRLRSEHHQFFVVQPFALGTLPEVEVAVPRGATLTVRVEPALVRQWRTRAGIAPVGEVSRSDRASLPGIKVWRSRPGNPESVPPQFDPSEPFDDAGTCVLRGLPPARWWVVLTIPYGRGWSNMDLDDLLLSDGEARELVLTLPELHEGEVRGAVFLNGSPLPSARVRGSIQLHRQREYPLNLSDQADTDATGRFTLHLPQGAAKLSVSSNWPGTDDWFSVDLPEAIPTASGAVVEHDVDLRMGRVRCTFVDARGKAVAGLPALIFGAYRTWSSPSDDDGRTRWLPLTAGEWRLVADPKRLLDPATRQAFNAAHEGDPDPTRLLRVDLGTITVTAGEDREVEVRVPDDWFR